jgi:antitoxin component YwqK of YwqJK toxin-antitoxin module
MSIKYLVPVLIILLLVSCSPKKIDKSGFSIKNNIVYRNDSNTPYTGIIKSKSEGKVFEYYVKDGLKNGEFKATFENGNLIMKGNIVNDMNEGKWVYYYPSGELESEGNFKYNKADSIWTWYFPSGKIKEKGMFVNGLREGNWKMFDELGNVSLENEYKNGVISMPDQK